MRSILILSVFLLQLVRIHHANYNGTWFFICTPEERKQMAIELPKLLNIERGKLARGERSYISDSGEYVKYEPATNMREVKWSSEIKQLANDHISIYFLENSFDGRELTRFFNEPRPDNLTLFYTAKVTKNAESCKKAWEDYAESNNQIKIDAAGLEHGKTVVYEDEARLESLKAVSVVSKIGCHQMVDNVEGREKDIVTICMHAVHTEKPGFQIENTYEEGEACSNCPSGTGCNSLKLCSVDSPPMTKASTTTVTPSTTVTTTTPQVISTVPSTTIEPTTTTTATTTTTQATTTQAPVQAPVQAPSQKVESQPLKAENEEEYEDCDDASWPTEFNKVFLAGFIIYYYFYYNYYYW